jgi:hypothetical protein
VLQWDTFEENAMTRIVTVQLVQVAEVELIVEDGDDPVQIAIDMHNSGDACACFESPTGTVVSSKEAE